MNKKIVQIKAIRELKDAKEFNNAYPTGIDITSFFNYHGGIKDSQKFEDNVLIKEASLLRILFKRLWYGMRR